jgi:hypothetical protein
VQAQTGTPPGELQSTDIARKASEVTCSAALSLERLEEQRHDHRHGEDGEHPEEDAEGVPLALQRVEIHVRPDDRGGAEGMSRVK